MISFVFIQMRNTHKRINFHFYTYILSSTYIYFKFQYFVYFTVIQVSSSAYMYTCVSVCVVYNMYISYELLYNLIR